MKCNNNTKLKKKKKKKKATAQANFIFPCDIRNNSFIEII